MPTQQQERPPQHQNQQPGYQTEMNPAPMVVDPDYQGSNKLKDKAALITGGDSGIGRSVAVLYAKEGADVAIIYLNETEDAEETKRLVEQEGRRCLLIQGDIGDEDFCREAVKQTAEEFGHLDILVNNAAEQQYNDDENRRVYPASEDPYGDPGDLGQFGNVRPASEDPYGDPADLGQFGNVRPASEDPYGDPDDEENRWA